MSEWTTSETTVEAEDLSVLWQALALAELIPTSVDAPRFHSPTAEEGLALDLEGAAIPGTEPKLSIERIGAPEKGFVPSRLLRVRLHGPASAARSAMTRLVRSIDAARRTSPGARARTRESSSRRALSTWSSVWRIGAA